MPQTTGRTLLAMTLGFLAITATACRPFGVAAGVSASRVRALAPGMSEADVRVLLGAPLAVRPWGEHAHLLDYAIEVPLAHRSPNLWVLIQDGHVDQVEATRSNLWKLDEEGLYGVRSGLRWEAPAFADTFK